MKTTSLTVTLTEDQLRQLKEKAERLQTTPEDLVRVSVDELLSRPDEAFERAVKYVLNKNAELYRRLASK